MALQKIQFTVFLVALILRQTEKIVEFVRQAQTDAVIAQYLLIPLLLEIETFVGKFDQQFSE